jgi:hypothetical protein
MCRVLHPLSDHTRRDSLANPSSPVPLVLACCVCTPHTKGAGSDNTESRDTGQQGGDLCHDRIQSIHQTTSEGASLSRCTTPISTARICGGETMRKGSRVHVGVGKARQDTLGVWKAGLEMLRGWHGKTRWQDKTRSMTCVRTTKAPTPHARNKKTNAGKQAQCEVREEGTRRRNRG